MGTNMCTGAAKDPTQEKKKSIRTSLRSSLKTSLTKTEEPQRISQHIPPAIQTEFGNISAIEPRTSSN